MPRTRRGEALAKAGIYALSTLSLVACFGYMSLTHQYKVAALAPDIVVPQPQAQAPAAVDEPVQLAGPWLPLEVPELFDAVRELLAEDESLWQEPLLPRVLETKTEVPLDAEALAVEIERMRAMGVELPNTLAPEYMGSFHNTAYCCEVYPHICGGNGITASGTVPTPGLTCAADWNVLPPGTWLYIADVGLRRVEDSGSAVKNMHLDIAVDTHANALRWWGFGAHDVWVLAWA